MSWQVHSNSVPAISLSINRHLMNHPYGQPSACNISYSMVCQPTEGPLCKRNLLFGNHNYRHSQHTQGQHAASLDQTTDHNFCSSLTLSSRSLIWRRAVFMKVANWASWINSSAGGTTTQQNFVGPSDVTQLCMFPCHKQQQWTPGGWQHHISNCSSIHVLGAEQVQQQLLVLLPPLLSSMSLEI